VRAVALVDIEVDDEDAPDEPAAPERPEGDHDVVEDTEAAPRVAEGVVRAPADVRSHAVSKRSLARKNRRAHGAPRALDELGRPREAEGEDLAPLELASLDAADPAVRVSERELLASRRARRPDVEACRLGPLPDEPVLRERKAVARREWIAVDVVREGLHGATLRR